MDKIAHRTSSSIWFINESTMTKIYHNNKNNSNSKNIKMFASKAYVYIIITVWPVRSNVIHLKAEHFFVICFSMYSILIQLVYIFKRFCDIYCDWQQTLVIPTVEFTYSQRLVLITTCVCACAYYIDNTVAIHIL